MKKFDSRPIFTFTEVIVGLIILAFYYPALAQPSSLPNNPEIEERINALEKRVKELETKGKSQDKSTSSAEQYSSTGNVSDLKNWRRIKRGMGETEVKQLLGEPNKIDAGVAFTYWKYHGYSYVMFDIKTMKVDGWKEP